MSSSQIFIDQTGIFDLMADFSQCWQLLSLLKKWFFLKAEVATDPFQDEYTSTQLDLTKII